MDGVICKYCKQSVYAMQPGLQYKRLPGFEKEQSYKRVELVHQLVKLYHQGRL